MGISLQQLKNTIMMIKNYCNNKFLSKDSISKENNNAIINKEDGLYAKDFSNEITSLNNRSVISEKLKTFYANGELKSVSINSNTNLLSILTTVTKDSDIELTDDNFLMLKQGSTYQINVSIYKQSHNTSSTYITVKDDIGNIIHTGGYIPVGSYAGIGFEYIKTFENDTNIGIYFDLNGDISASLSYISIIEIGREIMRDPIKYAQDYETEEILFESESETYVDSNNITLSKDFTEFDELEIEYKGSSTGLGSIVFKTDTIYNTMITSNYMSISGYSDYYITFNALDTKTIKITGSNNYGIIRIIGKKSKNPVMVEYTSARVGFDETVLFEGCTNVIGEYSLIDNVENYDYIRVFHKLNSDSLGSFDEFDSKELIEQNNYYRDISSFCTTNAWYSIRTQLYKNKLKIYEVNKGSNWNMHTPCIYKVTGIRGEAADDYSNLSPVQKANLSASLTFTSESITDEEITNGVSGLWEV